MAFDWYESWTGFSLQFDWAKAGLSMDLSICIFPYCTKTSFEFLSGQGRHRAACYVVADLYFTPCRENLRDLLFCLDLSLSRSTDHQDCNLH